MKNGGTQPKKILTTPQEIDKNERVFYTGNHYISLPEISVADASVKSLNIISTKNKGLIQLKGEKALFKPVFYRNGKRLEIKSVSASMESYFFPRYVFVLEDDSCIVVTIYADRTEKGFFFQFNSVKAMKVKMYVQLNELSFLRFNSYPIEFSANLQENEWLENPLLLVQAPSGEVSFAAAFGAETPLQYEKNEANNEYIFSFPCNKETAFYVAMNADGDGASTTLIHLKRKGYENMKDEFLQWITEKKVSYAKEKELEDRLNQNLFFNYFFAVGKDFYNDDYIAMTSRSPRYYVSGAFWERDSFLWSFPAIKIVDDPLFQRLVKENIIRHARNAGDHAHYLDGTVLYPGFELDGAASYFVLLDRVKFEYVDAAFLEALNIVFNRIEEQYDKETGLYKTFLLPSDDPSEYPFVTINQFILLRGLANLRDLYGKLQMNDKLALIDSRMKGIRKGIDKYLVKRIRGKKMYVWSADKDGNYLLYNDPPGNIGLIPFYDKTVRAKDKTFKNTIQYYYSNEYYYYDETAEIKELACDHHPNTPSGLGLCGSLLNPLKRDEALDWLKKAKMDYGLLSESFDKNSGEAKTGVGFASGSGYLAYALYETLINGNQDERKKRLGYYV